MANLSVASVDSSRGCPRPLLHEASHSYMYSAIDIEYLTLHSIDGAMDCLIHFYFTASRLRWLNSENVAWTNNSGEKEKQWRLNRSIFLLPERKHYRMEEQVIFYAGLFTTAQNLAIGQLTMQQMHILHCTFRFYDFTNCDQLHVKICPVEEVPRFSTNQGCSGTQV